MDGCLSSPSGGRLRRPETSVGAPPAAHPELRRLLTDRVSHGVFETVRRHLQHRRQGGSGVGGGRVGQMLLSQVQLLTTLKVGILEAAERARSASAAAAAGAGGVAREDSTSAKAAEAMRAETLRRATEALLQHHLDAFDLDCACTTFTEISRQFVPHPAPGQNTSYGAHASELLPLYHARLMKSMGHTEDNGGAGGAVAFDCSLGTRPQSQPPQPLHEQNPTLQPPSQADRFSRRGGSGASQVPNVSRNYRATRTNPKKSGNDPLLQGSNGASSSSDSLANRLGFQAARSASSYPLRGANLKNNENGARNRAGNGTGAGPKTLGMKRKFKPPRMGGGNNNCSSGYQQNGNRQTRRRGRPAGGWNNGGISGAIQAANRMNSEAHGGGDHGDGAEEEIPERLKGIDPTLIEAIENDIIGSRVNVKWDDIAGLEFAKRTCQEIVVLPIISPHLFSGLRRLPKGLLLFGPPGTGKTMIGKAIASQSGATFFSISASSLTSKWIGQVCWRVFLT